MTDNCRQTAWPKVCIVAGLLLVGCALLLIATHWLPAGTKEATALDDPPSAVKTPNPSVAVSESLSVADLLVYHNPYWAGMMPVCIAASIGLGATLLLIALASKLASRGRSEGQ